MLALRVASVRIRECGHTCVSVGPCACIRVRAYAGVCQERSRNTLERLRSVDDTMETYFNQMLRNITNTMENVRKRTESVLDRSRSVRVRLQASSSLSEAS